MKDPSSAPPRSARRPPARPLHRFWERVTEGRQLEDLWSQFSADARATYGFYGKEVDWEKVQRLPRMARPSYVAKEFFWALLMKMSPARRVLLLLSFVLLIFNLHFQFGSENQFDINLRFFAPLFLLVLLALELADKVTMKRDLEIAREIQSWLVPAQPPEVANADIAFATRPQNSVAGDYYDAFYPGESREKLVVVIADVAGKSVPAALLMATLQASLRTIAGEGASVAELVLRLNRYVSAYSLGGLRFTTAVIGEYDPAARTLSYVNAGHNAPILRRANGDLETLETGGLPLGIDANAPYEVGSIQLRSGDALIFFTDGVVEAFNQGGEEFGNDRWVACIRNLPSPPAKENLRYLMGRVDEFVGATRQSDDITCMVFRSL